MATELEIRVTAELTQIKASLAQLSTSIQAVNTKANQGGTAANGLASGLGKAATQGKAAAAAAGTMNDKIGQARSSLASLLAGIGIVGVVTGIVRMADTYTRLTGQLKLATDGINELNRAQAETFDIAQRTRQGLEATVNLYARIARAGKTSQEGTLQLTESINQAVSLSFTSASAGEAALFQLGQALASGTLRGDELNSVLEQTPRLAQAIADGLVKLGKIKDPGGLRAYAQANGIAAADVIAAIQSQREKLTAEFAKLTPTVADAFTALRNAVMKFVGDTNSATGATNELAAAILLVANNVEGIANALVEGAKLWVAYYAAFRVLPVAITVFGASFTALKTSIASTAASFRAYITGATAVGTASAAAAVEVNVFSLSMSGAAIAGSNAATKLKVAGAVIFAAFAGYEIGTYLKEQFLEVELAGIALAAGLTKVGNNIGNNFLQVGAVVKAALAEAFNFVLSSEAAVLQKLADVQAKIPGVGNALAGTTQKAVDALKGYQVQTETIGEAIARINAKNIAENAAIDQSYEALADAAIAARQETAKVTDSGKPDGGATGKGVKNLTDQFALLKDAAERALAKLDQLYADAGISTKAYYTQRIALQQAAIDADIAAAQRDAGKAKTDDARSAALTKIIILERQRRDVALQGAHDQAEAEKDLADKLADVQAALLEAQGQGAAAKTMQLEAQYKDLLKRLDAEADTAGKELVRKLINVEAAKAGLDQFKKEYSDTTGALAQLDATTSAQVSAGLLSNATAEKRMEDARATALTQLQQQREAVAALYAQYKDPDTLLHLQQLDQQIAQLSISTDDWRGKLQDAGTDSLTTFFKEIADGSHTAGEAVVDLARNFTQALAAMAAQALAKKAISAIFDAFSNSGDGDNGAGQVASAAAAGLAYSIPVTTAATALGTAGGVVAAGAAAVGVAAAALQVAANTLLVANAVGSASVAHIGGVVGGLAMSRSVPGFLFAGAPRYHTGGVAGLRPDEVPTVLKRGEEVLTRNDPRHRYNGGQTGDSAQSAQPQRFIFVDDQRQIANYLNSPDGEKVQIEFISRNAGAVREILKG